MIIKVIKIGNSKGIILPKTILSKYDIKNQLEITLGEVDFILKPINKPRAGWAEASKKISKLGEDRLLIPDLFENENLNE